MSDFHRKLRPLTGSMLVEEVPNANGAGYTRIHNVVAYCWKGGGWQFLLNMCNGVVGVVMALGLCESSN